MPAKLLGFFYQPGVRTMVGWFYSYMMSVCLSICPLTAHAQSHVVAMVTVKMTECTLFVAL